MNLIKLIRKVIKQKKSKNNIKSNLFNNNNKNQVWNL